MLERAEPETAFVVVDGDEYPGFEIEVCYIGQNTLSQIVQDSSSQVTVAKRKRRDRSAMELRVDRSKYNRLIVQKAVRGWRGLKLEYLEKMLELTDNSREQIKSAGGELPYSREDALLLAESVSDEDFIDPIVEVVKDYHSYKELIAAKNLGNSAGSSTTSKTSTGRVVARSATS